MMSFSDSAFAKLLRQVAQVVSRHPKWFVYPQILLSVIGLLYAVHSLKLDMNRDHLVSAKTQAEQVYRYFEKEFPGEGDELVAVVESNKPEFNREAGRSDSVPIRKPRTKRELGFWAFQGRRSDVQEFQQSRFRLAHVYWNGPPQSNSEPNRGEPLVSRPPLSGNFTRGP